MSDLTEQYRNAANLDARIDLHSRFSTNQLNWYRWLFDHLALPEGARVLELGCGPAKLWRENLRRVPQSWDVTLTDASPGMLEEARAYLENEPRTFAYEVVDAQAIPFDDASFDAVIAVHMLYHVPDQPRALREIRRVLKPEGHFYASTNGRTHMQEIGDLAAHFTKSSAKYTTKRAYGKVQHMLSAERLRKRPKHFHNFSGLSVEQFDTLVAAVAEVQNEQQTNDELRQVKQRQRAPGGGRLPKLDLENQVLVSLIYYRLYITQLLLGYLFALDDSNVSRLIRRLQPLLADVLPVPVQEALLFSESSRTNKRIGSLEDLLEKYPEIQDVLIDATEQQVQKPKDKKKRRDNYSGKKKCHSLKTQATTSKTGLFLHLSRSIAGKVSDLHLLRASQVLHALPVDVGVGLDKGYDSIDQEHPERLFHQPTKARRNKPLDFIQKSLNQNISTFRIQIEHAFAHLQRFKLLAGIYRGVHSVYDDTFLTIAGLHNFRKLNRLAW